VTLFVTGLVLGLAGSTHCVAMCGPLVLSIGRVLGRGSRACQLRHAILYHAGRVLTYALLAVPLGLAGQALWVQGFERAVAVFGAVLLLAMAAPSGAPWWTGRATARASAAAARLCIGVNRWSQDHPLAGPLVCGAANGFMPCGLVLAAVTAAAASGSAAGAVLLMIGFGLGTLPVLAALSIAPAALPLHWRFRLRHLTPAVLVLTATLLLARAMVSADPSPHHSRAAEDNHHQP
jgi:sulfite exporter TauE/SafE